MMSSPAADVKLDIIAASGLALAVIATQPWLIYTLNYVS